MVPKETKNKHMTLQDRIEIQECISKGMTFKDIARRIGKASTTVSREVKLHARVHTNGFTKSDGVCPRLLKAPFVCNGCPKRSNSGCKLKRQIYDARYAQNVYETTLTDCRTGIALNKESFYETEKILSNAVRQGQHYLSRYPIQPFARVHLNGVSAHQSEVLYHRGVGSAESR